MISKNILVVYLILCLVLMSAFVSFAVEEFKVSENGNGKQVWFEAEHFDERDSEDIYKLGKAEGALDPIDGAFGDIVTNAGNGAIGWLLYSFDISLAGGEAGQWRFIGRVINPNNHSDWLWVQGDDGDEIPKVAPAFVRPDDIIFEEDVPVWTWMPTGDFGKDGGTINTLQAGENIMMIWTRSSSLEVQYDVFCWSSDLEYQPTDEDYEKAANKTLSVHPKGRLTTTWGNLKNQ